MPRILKFSLLVSVLCPLAPVHAQTTAVVIQEGDAPPDGNGTFSSFFAPALNDAGQVAFIARLTGASGRNGGNKGIFLHDDALGLRKVARVGDAFLGSTITRLGFSSSIPSNDDDRSGLNELGQVAYSFELADGKSGIAIWNVPEPATAALLALAGLTLLRARYRTTRKQSDTIG